MKAWLFILAGLLPLLAGCNKEYEQVFHPVFHNETLASGKTVKVTMLALVWGAQTNNDDGCVMGGDCFHLEYVSNIPNADVTNRTAEAREVFQLIRPMSEQWGFTNAEMLGFKQLERTGDYDLFEFERATNGNWSCKQQTMSVFAK